MLSLPLALQPLGAYNQFIVYKLVPSVARPGKTDKLPIDARTGKMSPKGQGGSMIWTDAQTAIDAANRLGAEHGVGFSFATTDPFFFLDIDDCLVTYDDGRPSHWSELAMSLMAAFPGAAIEVSQSGRGLHIIGSGNIPPHACKNTPYGLELYHADRFVALTGNHASGSASTDMSYVLPWLVNSYFPLASPGATSTLSNWEDHLGGPVEEWNGPSDDTNLIDRALRSMSAAGAFGNKATFADLWNGDEDAITRAYGVDGRSEADAALAQHLAFWTGKDAQRIHDLMYKSGLYREKWDLREGYYLPLTIGNACARQRDVLQDKPPQSVELRVEYEVDASTGVAAAKPSLVNGSTYLSVDQQMEVFKGCVYVTDAHKILMPGGTMLKPDQFRAVFGGFTFPMDAGNERLSRNAWECFTESQAFRAPRADSSCFDPTVAFGTIVFRDGRKLVNTYWPIDTPRRQGDATPFYTHLAKVLPNERDRTILLSFMAACVQHRGVKFQWAPLLQGVEGNGKTLFTRCVAFAIGDRYSHYPKASQIAKQFNGWMHGNLFIGVEDIYVADSQREVIEELKPMITGDRLEIEKKGVDQATLGVCCNFMLNSNHKDGIRKTKNDRRFALFYTAQQQNEDLLRDGMTNGYFPALYDWLKKGGYEIVNELLHTYQIPDDLNPANGHIAPITSSTNEAIKYGLGRVEQEILEAIDREELGFKGGWVSSIWLERLLERIRMSSAIPPNKRRELMVSLGYDYHPALTDGRTNNAVMPDAGKPRLYIRKADLSVADLLRPADVAAAYSTAQQVT
jgi:hypothetical protein